MHIVIKKDNDSSEYENITIYHGDDLATLKKAISSLIIDGVGKRVKPLATIIRYIDEWNSNGYVYIDLKYESSISYELVGEQLVDISTVKPEEIRVINADTSGMSQHEIVSAAEILEKYGVTII